MKKVTLSEQDMAYVKSFVKNDIIESASNLSFFFDMKLEPKDFIDQMKGVAKMLDMDFWEIINSNCSTFHSSRLRDLYEGKFTSAHITSELPNLEVIRNIRKQRLRQELSSVGA